MAILISAGEDLKAGDFVSFMTCDEGQCVVRACAKHSDRPAHGFVTTSTKKGTIAYVVREGVNKYLRNLSIGKNYYLSIIPGHITAVAPRTKTHIQQLLGTPTSKTSLTFEFNDFIINQ